MTPGKDPRCRLWPQPQVLDLKDNKEKSVQKKKGQTKKR